MAGSLVPRKKEEPALPPRRPAVALADLGEMIKDLDAHVANAANLQKDDLTKGSGPSMSTTVIRVITGLFALGIVSAFFMGDELQVIVGCISGPGFLIFALLALASASGDKAAQRIQESATPVLAFKRFFRAAARKRCSPLLAATVPAARAVADVRPLPLTKIPLKDCPAGFDDQESYKKYLAYVFDGGGTNSRSVSLGRVKHLRDLPGDVAVVEATIRFTSQSAAASALMGGLLMLLLQKRESLVVRKLLIRRKNRWYFLSAELEGDIDRLAVDC